MSYTAVPAIPGGSGIRLRSTPVAHGSEISVLRFGAWLVLHVVLALAMKQVETVSIAHGIATLTLGFAWTWFGTNEKRLDQLILYIAGMEVLWRMTSFGLFWEISKYSIIFLAMVGTFVHRRRLFALPVTYMLLLIPSVFLVDLADSRSQSLMRFCMAGPMMLGMSALYYYDRKLTTEDLCGMLAALLGPIVGVSTIAAYSTLTAKVIHFSGSNFVTAGGFGPNQVSAVLGLGALTAFLWAQRPKLSPTLRLLLYCLVPVLLVQTALTFSRGGVYSAVAGVMAGLTACLMTRHNAMWKFKAIAVFLIFATLAATIVVPALNDFTQGKLGERFERSGSSRRDEIALADLNLFAEHPFLGVGPGASQHYRAVDFTGMEIASHTEYTRMMAEHGLFGAGSILILLYMCVAAMLKTRGFWMRMVCTSFTIWSLLFLLVNSFRLGIPGLMIGLMLADLRDDPEPTRYSRHAVRDEGEA